jgi:hypothetical protein
MKALIKTTCILIALFGISFAATYDGLITSAVYLVSPTEFQVQLYNPSNASYKMLPVLEKTVRPLQFDRMYELFLDALVNGKKIYAQSDATDKEFTLARIYRQ